jgi:hypothetical protein
MVLSRLTTISVSETIPEFNHLNPNALGSPHHVQKREELDFDYRTASSLTN